MTIGFRFCTPLAMDWAQWRRGVIWLISISFAVMHVAMASMPVMAPVTAPIVAVAALQAASTCSDTRPAADHTEHRHAHHAPSVPHEGHWPGHQHGEGEAHCPLCVVPGLAEAAFPTLCIKPVFQAKPIVGPVPSAARAVAIFSPVGVRAPPSALLAAA